METPNTAAPSENRARYWFRVLRPLQWWLLLVLVLYGIRTHQRWMQQTRLIYSVGLEGRPIDYEASVKLDGVDCSSDQMLSLGRHEFTVSHPKAVPFTTNLFIWYGPHNLGRIQLVRNRGTLAIEASPPASLLVIRGPEFKVTLTNTPGMTSSVPTDRYTVEAKYAHWQDEREVAVITGVSSPWRFAPRLGTTRVECNHAGASFQFLANDGRVLEQGEFPSVLTDYPEGAYKLVALHHGTRREDWLAIKAGATNDLRVEFAYGGAVLETDPPGAVVLNSEGRQWGVTPLTLPELSVGRYTFTLRRQGYEPASASLDIVADQTNSFRTNLINLKYASVVSAARQHLAAGEYSEAMAAVGEALNFKSDDPAVAVLMNEITGAQGLRRAKDLAQKGSYAAAITQLESALKALPDNAEAKQLLADFKPRATVEVEQRRLARLSQGKELFSTVLEKHPDGDLFESHEIKTTKPAKEVHQAIFEAFKGQPGYRVTKNTSAGETFTIEAIHEFTTYLDTSAGRRECVIVGAQSRDDETQILFKVLEFKAKAKGEEKFSLGNLIGTPVSVDFVPIHPSRFPVMNDKLKAQLQEGVPTVTAIIQKAIGQ